jgi:RNA polymerase sigma factor (sigma-70 family)
MAKGAIPEAEVNRLVQENRRLVDFAVNRYLKRHHLHGIERDDLVSWGLVGLFHAARAWDASRGLAFSTLAVTAIERMISRGVRSEWRESAVNATLSLDALLCEDGDEGASRERHLDQLEDETSDVEEAIVRLETRLMLRQAVSELTPDQQWVVQQRFFKHRTLQEMAAEAGTTRQAIHLREQTILRALRRKLGAALQASA